MCVYVRLVSDSTEGMRGGLQIRLCLLQALPDVLLVHDVVPVKDDPGGMPANRHGDLFRHPRPHHIPHRCPPEIMKELPLNACLLTRRFPRIPEVIDLNAIPMEYPGNEVYPCKPPVLNNLRQLANENQQSSLFGL